MKPTKLLLTLPLLVGGLHAQDAAAPEAANSASFTQAVKEGKASLDARLRYESGEQDGLQDSDAFTGRIRLGFETGSWNGLQALVEFEGTSALNDEDDYDALPPAGTHTVIADPENAELNRLQLSWSYEDTTVIAGRQRINLGNQRFLGAVGWRQNEQTYDGVAIVSQAVEDVTLVYGWIDQVNRIFGNDAGGALERLHTNAHAVNLTYSGWDFGTITLYDYYLDVENAATASSNSVGANININKAIGTDGDYNLSLYGEYAQQSETADNPTNYKADYYHLNGTVSRGNYSIGLGYEVLGSDDGIASFQTPLATLHKFNGFADVFLTTPADGLEDFYVVAKCKCTDQINLAAFYHNFDSDEGSTDLGDEWDLVASYKYDEHWSGTAKFADYSQGDATSPADTQRFSLQIDYKF